MLKPKKVQLALSQYILTWEEGNAQAEEALKNLEKTYLRDISGGPNKKASKYWQSPDKMREEHYDEFLMATNITIPFKLFHTVEEESDWINTACINIAQRFKEIMQEPVFAELLEAAVNSEVFWKRMTKETDDYQMNYENFIENCKVKAEKVDNFNSYIIQDEANRVMNLLFEARLPAEKYGDDDASATDPDADDSEEEDEDEKKPEAVPANTKKEEKETEPDDNNHEEGGKEENNEDEDSNQAEE